MGIIHKRLIISVLTIIFLISLFSCNSEKNTDSDIISSGYTDSLSHISLINQEQSSAYSLNSSDSSTETESNTPSASDSTASVARSSTGKSSQNSSKSNPSTSSTSSSTGIDYLLISNMESIDSWEGNNSIVIGKSTTPFEGSGYLESQAKNDIVFAKRNLNIDLSGYEDDGRMHLAVYISNVSAIKGGQIELTSSGVPDKDEISFGEFNSDIPLKNGWNKIDLPFSKAGIIGTPNFKKINYVRIYFNLMGNSSIVGIDNFYIYHGNKNDENPELTEAMSISYSKSIIYLGSKANRAALKGVMQKAQNGKKIKLAVLGDSITAGASATGSNAWASRVQAWLSKKFPQSTIELLNAGIGSTEAVFGVSRLEKDVIAHNPDLVIVDFGTNDVTLPHAQEAYEGIITKLISNGIPTVNFNVCPENGQNIQDKQKPINIAYGIPQISFKSAYYDRLELNKDIPGLRKSDIWSSDHVHPTNNGHFLISDLITTYFQKEILQSDIAPGTQPKNLPAPVTANRFADAVLMESNDSYNSKLFVKSSDWKSDYNARFYQLSTQGWQTETFDSSIVFEVKAGYFYIFFALTPKSGDLEIKVDGTTLSTITYAHLGTGYMNPYHILHLPDASTHTVELILRKNSKVTDPWFGICGVGASNFLP